MNLETLSTEDLRRIEGGFGGEPETIVILGNVIHTNGVGNQNL
ncbi:hypothetical protein [Chryseobacterium carnipullorum]|uniref:Uncharacterized protein n=1 Tax=Chryseobacterium carnipullorum TaxID=1124835 RepID=A0A376DMT5_CHRCU|nr:hypothetical protein [Chryseobacterium carnipullorum]STC92052.1 Uncharacterised protein [Chryseobacterium carnipullorum]